MCCGSWGRKESDTTECLNCTELFSTVAAPIYISTNSVQGLPFILTKLNLMFLTISHLLVNNKF